MPTVSWRPVSNATISLVPTLSVPATSTGARILRAPFSPISAPKPPTPLITCAPDVAFAIEPNSGIRLCFSAISTLAVGISDQAFAVLFNLESGRERAKFSVTEQKARIARVADRGLVDEERLGNQPAAGPERAHEFREQRAVEEIYVHDGVERFVLQMKAIQVCDDGPDAQPRGARSRGEKAHRFGREINRDHSHARVSERECVSPASGRDVEPDAARHPREHLCEEWFGLAR